MNEKLFSEKKLKEEIEKLSLTVFNIYSEKNVLEAIEKNLLDEKRELLDEKRKLLDQKKSLKKGLKMQDISINELKKKNIKLKLAIKNQNKILNEMESSNSWKLTRPLRKIAKSLK